MALSLGELPRWQRVEIGRCLVRKMQGGVLSSEEIQGLITDDSGLAIITPGNGGAAIAHAASNRFARAIKEIRASDDNGNIFYVFTCSHTMNEQEVANFKVLVDSLFPSSHMQYAGN